MQIEVRAGESRLVPLSERLRRLPWWALAAALLGILFAWHIHTDQTYNQIFRAILSGVSITLYVTAVAYSAALVLGLLLAFARLSRTCSSTSRHFLRGDRTGRAGASAAALHRLRRL